MGRFQILKAIYICILSLDLRSLEIWGWTELGKSWRPISFGWQSDWSIKGIPRKSPRKALHVSGNVWREDTSTRPSVTPCVSTENNNNNNNINTVSTEIFIKYLLSILVLFIILIWASKVGKAFDAAEMWCKIKWDVRQCNESIATISGFTTHIDCLIFCPILSWFLPSYWLIILSSDWLDLWSDDTWVHTWSLRA